MGSEQRRWSELVRRLRRVRTRGLLGGFHSGWGWLAAAVASLGLFLGLLAFSQQWVIACFIGAWVGTIGFVVDLIATTQRQKRGL